jgi:hypothetical protein
MMPSTTKKNPPIKPEPLSEEVREEDDELQGKIELSLFT